MTDHPQELDPQELDLSQLDQASGKGLGVAHGLAGQNIDLEMINLQSLISHRQGAVPLAGLDAPTNSILKKS
jgi:hypothetical protein